MEIRNLGSSGLKISAIAYGNWLTHGSQVEEDAALACVRQALDEGITTFDTADVYANTKAETVLGKALQGERREGLEILTKVYWPTGPGAHNDHGLSRKHILESINGSLRRLGTDYVDVYQAHRYDYETPLEETMEAFADVVHSGKAHYIGVSEWRAEEIRAAHELARELRISLVSNQPQYNMLWRVIEAEVVPTSEELGLGQVVFSPIAQGVLTGKYKPGQAHPAGSRATDEKGGADMISRWLDDDVLGRVQQLQPIADEAGLSMAALAVAWVLQNPNVSAAIIGASRPEQVTENVKAAGVKLDVELLKRIDEALDGVVTHRPRQDQVTGEAHVRLRVSTGSTTRSGPRPPVWGSALRVQAHRPVDLALALEERDLLDPVVEQVAPDLPDPRLGVALRREAGHAGRRTPAGLGRLGAGSVLEAPAPGRLGRRVAPAEGGGRFEGVRHVRSLTGHDGSGL